MGGRGGGVKRNLKSAAQSECGLIKGWIAGRPMDRAYHGLPGNWAKIERWLNTQMAAEGNRTAADGQFKKKCPELPVLSHYSRDADADFWDRFPRFVPASVPQGKIDTAELERLIARCWDKWGYQQKKIAVKTLKFLKEGAKTNLLYPLPGLNYPNAKSAFENGELLTDTIAAWVKNKVVAGPFPSSPLNFFRCNPLMAVKQKNKVRPILNLSAPAGASFNDAVNPDSLRKLTMSSAKEFGFELLRAGRWAEMAKFDLSDAFKIIPGHPEQWALFGFAWLGKYFFDVTTVFGSASAPANFDGLPETLANIISVLDKVPKSLIFRQLDDSLFVSPFGSGNTQKFAEAYTALCQKLRVPLAEMCPLREKAFGPGQSGTVLGIKFDSASLSWSLGSEKAAGVADLIDRFLVAATCNLKDVQRLHGKLNDFGQMLPFTKGFRFNLLDLMNSFGGSENERKLVKSELKRDLYIWKNCLVAAAGGLPLSGLPCEPPVRALKFVSDAAGAAFEWTEGRSVNVSKNGDRGVASVGFDSGKIWFCGGTKWPENFLRTARDRSGKFFGTKSTCLEAVGLVVPFLTIPAELCGKFIVLYVDNLNVVYAWEKRHCKADAETSALIRALHIVEARLACKIFVRHMARMSTPMAALADRLSRDSSTSAADRGLLEKVGWRQPGGALEKWLAAPRVDWELGLKLVKDIDQILNIMNK